MVLWFAALAYTGAESVLRNPQVLAAVNPVLGFQLLRTHQAVALVILGGVWLIYGAP